MRRFALTCAVFVTAPVFAQDTWTRLDTDEITKTLLDTSYVYEDGATQSFYASGRTLYTDVRDSWGTWEARDDRYCSQWPPANGWACYDFEQRGTEIRFIGDSGNVTSGVRQ